MNEYELKHDLKAQKTPASAPNVLLAVASSEALRVGHRVNWLGLKVLLLAEL